jgi:hypothetical protein
MNACLYLVIQDRKISSALRIFDISCRERTGTDLQKSGLNIISINYC